VNAPPWALAFLGEARIGRLATADARARPLVVPVCYVFDGERLYSAVDAKPKRTRALRRLKNIADNPRVALVVDHYDEDWEALRYVLVEGTADVLTRGPDFARAIDLLVEKYPQYRAMELDRAEGAVIRIAPDRIVAWQSSSGRFGVG
jgi:PPOX class probable F420-dependent enzyme